MPEEAAASPEEGDKVRTEFADFQGKTFTEVADFQGMTFTSRADFRDAIFTEKANFERAIFNEMVSFEGAKFARLANFEAATFIKLADFQRAIFTEEVIFRHATFTEDANFTSTKFTKSADFVNSQMKSITSFIGASFLSMPPFFDGAQIHESTMWFEVIWPPAPREREAVHAAIRGYERLRLEMEKLKKTEDELSFYALELQARRVMQGRWLTVEGLAIGVFGWLGDYGRSYTRPILLLAVVSLAGAVPFLVHFGLPGLRGSLALSVANTFGILGLRRDFFPPSDIIALPWILKLVSGIQTVAGGVLFFLFGLGLRNRFRLRASP